MATLDEIRLQQLLQPFNNQTGIMSSNNAIPMINNVPMINTGAMNQNNDLIQQLIAQNQQKLNLANTADTASFFFPQEKTTPLQSTAPLSNLDLSSLPANMGVANEEDAEQDQEYIDQVDENNQSGIMKVLRSLPGPFNLVLDMLKGEDPAVTSMRNFYRNQYGLTDAGSLASGIMRGYNPVSGGLFGQPISYGLADAARRRIENIATRKAPQTAASRAKIAALQKFAERDTISRARQAAPDVYRDAGREGRLGPGGGFSTSGREGAFSSKSGRGRKDF
jgi:hypothetical protein